MMIIKNRRHRKEVHILFPAEKQSMQIIILSHLKTVIIMAMVIVLEGCTIINQLKQRFPKNSYIIQKKINIMLVITNIQIRILLIVHLKIPASLLEEMKV